MVSRASTGYGEREHGDLRRLWSNTLMVDILVMGHFELKFLVRRDSVHKEMTALLINILSSVFLPFIIQSCVKEFLPVDWQGLQSDDLFALFVSMHVTVSTGHSTGVVLDC